MSEITQFDGKILKPLFKKLHKTGLGTPIVQLAMKILEYVANGPHPKGRYGKRIKWSDFEKILLIGQSHLDAAWRWRTKQGIIKARATFKKALDHIDELPYFTYLQPSPQYYQWTKDTDPQYISQLYPRIKKAVAEGRWIPFGGCWVEPDTNIPCGEALVRQRFYGQRFYLKEFGFLSDVEFLMDCFGFNWNLPQIYKKSGAKMFGTGKLFWNRNTKIPIGMCKWEGPDGTKIPMVHINFGYFLPITIGKDYPKIYNLGKRGKKLTADYNTPIEKIREWQSKELMMEQPFGYGLGDGGHGPIEFELLVVRTMHRLMRKKVKYYQRGDLYSMFKKYFNRWATWRDEWYLDLHRGTYTSVSIIKRGNRDCENKIIQLESEASLINLLGVYKPQYSRAQMEKYWKFVLYNQFHDILPGSSCPEVYVDYENDKKEFDDFYVNSSFQINRDIMNHFGINTKFGFPIIIFNSLSWKRDDVIKINIGKQLDGSIRDLRGNILPTFIIENNWQSLNTMEKDNFALFKSTIEPLSLNLFYFDKDVKTIYNNIEYPVKIEEIKNHFILENKILQCKINKKSGLIDSIINKEDNFEYLNGPSNKILVFQEKKATDAWNIDPEYNINIIRYNLEDCIISILENNPLRCTIEIKRTIKDSLFIQRISLLDNSNVLKTNLEIDMKNEKWMVKLDFDTIIKTNIASAEISYAYIDRNIEPQTKLDSARWEFACQKWCSIYDTKKSVSFSLINNGKYAFNAIKDPITNTVHIRPTIVRTPKFTGYAPETKFVNKDLDGGIDPNLPHFTDLELHKDIEFGIIVQKGDWRNKVWNRSYELNNRLESNILQFDKINKSKYDIISKKTDMSLPVKFASLDCENVRISSIKIHEDDIHPEECKSIILRCVEMTGIKTECNVNIIKELVILKVQSLNLLEIEDEPRNIIINDRNSFKFSIKPYEIATIMISFQ